MSHNRPQAVCHQCQTRETRAASGLCSRCRADAVPTVEQTEDGLIRVGGCLVLTSHAAVTLAHRIADECTP